MEYNFREIEKKWHLVGLVLDPFLVPFLLGFSEVVFHCLYLIILFLFLNIIR